MHLILTRDRRRTDSLTPKRGYGDRAEDDGDAPGVANRASRLAIVGTPVWTVVLIKVYRPAEADTMCRTAVARPSQARVVASAWSGHDRL